MSAGAFLQGVLGAISGGSNNYVKQRETQADILRQIDLMMMKRQFDQEDYQQRRKDTLADYETQKLDRGAEADQKMVTAQDAEGNVVTVSLGAAKDNGYKVLPDAVAGEEWKQKNEKRYSFDDKGNVVEDPNGVSVQALQVWASKQNAQATLEAALASQAETRRYHNILSESKKGDYYKQDEDGKWVKAEKDDAGAVDAATVRSMLSTEQKNNAAGQKGIDPKSQSAIEANLFNQYKDLHMDMAGNQKKGSPPWDEYLKSEMGRLLGGGRSSSVPEVIPNVKERSGAGTSGGDVNPRVAKKNTSAQTEAVIDSYNSLSPEDQKKVLSDPRVPQSVKAAIQQWTEIDSRKQASNQDPDVLEARKSALSGRDKWLFDKMTPEEQLKFLQNMR